jgi:hypothetical protein
MTHLCGDDTQAEYATWLLELDEREQMHALILSFFEQGVDPAMVVVHPTERTKVAKHATCLECRRCVDMPNKMHKDERRGAQESKWE